MNERRVHSFPARGLRRELQRRGGGGPGPGMGSQLPVGDDSPVWAKGRRVQGTEASAPGRRRRLWGTFPSCVGSAEGAARAVRLPLQGPWGRCWEVGRIMAEGLFGTRTRGAPRTFPRSFLKKQAPLALRRLENQCRDPAGWSLP